MRHVVIKRGQLAIWAMSSLLAAAIGGGCSSPGGSTEILAGAKTDAELFGPLSMPLGFDRPRAMLRLNEIPDEPPAPPPAKVPVGLNLSPNGAGLLSEAKRLFSDQRYTETVLQIEKVLAEAPDCAPCHRLMAVACLLGGNDGRARLSAQRGLSIRPDDLTCHYVLGRIADKAGKTDEALRSYRASLKCQAAEDDADYLILAHYRLGMLLDRQGYLLAGIAELEAFETGLTALGDKVNQSPELGTIARLQRGPAAIRVGQAYALLGDYDAAADALERAEEALPKDFDLRREFVRMLGRAGRLNDAITQARRFVTDSEGSAEAVALLLAIHRFAGKPEAGIAAMREIVEHRPDDVKLWLLYVDALIAQSAYERAADTLAHLIARHPDSPEARWKLIGVQRSRQTWATWLLSLADILVNEPGQYGAVGRELDQVSETTAGSLVDEAIASGDDITTPALPDGADNRLISGLDYLLGRLCDRLDRVDDALRFFKRAITRTPDFLPGTVGMAELYAQRYQWADAIEVIEAAARSRPEPSYLLEKLLGKCHDGLDAHEPAITHYTKAIEMHASDVDSLMLLGELYERRGHWSKARRQYETAIAVDENNMRAREALIRVLLASTGDASVAAGRVPLEFVEMQKRRPNDPATLRCSALLKFLQDGDRETYTSALRALIESYPDDLRSREELATTYQAFRDYEAARLELAELLARDPRSARGREVMAVVLTKLLRFAEAGEQYERILAMHPNRQAWIRNLAGLRMFEQNYEAASTLWQRLLSLLDQSDQATIWVYRHRLLEAYRLANRLDEAGEMVRAWLAQVEGAPKVEALILAGYRWFALSIDQAAGDHDRYLERCRRWLEADPTDREARRWLIGVTTGSPFDTDAQLDGQGGLIGARRFDEALIQVLAWLADDPDDATLIGWLAEVLQSAGRSDEAIELAQTLMVQEKVSEAQRGRLYLQAMYTRARRYEEAADMTRGWIAVARKQLVRAKPIRQMELGNDIYEQTRMIGTLLSQAGRFEDAIAEMEGLIGQLDREEHQAETLRTLSFVHQRQGRLDLAEDRLREAYRLVPTDIGLNNDLGYTLADAGKDLAEAERMIRLAVGEQPGQPAYLDSLGWVLYKRGKLDEARTWLTRALANPLGHDAVIYDHLGDVLWRLGESDKAVANWERSLAVYEKQWSIGQADTNEALVERIKSKLDAVSKGQTPSVAPISSETAPASTPSG